MRGRVENGIIIGYGKIVVKVLIFFMNIIRIINT